jgi:hypothetical protein
MGGGVYSFGSVPSSGAQPILNPNLDRNDKKTPPKQKNKVRHFNIADNDETVPMNIQQQSAVAADHMASEMRARASANASFVRAHLDEVENTKSRTPLKQASMARSNVMDALLALNQAVGRARTVHQQRGKTEEAMNQNALSETARRFTEHMARVQQQSRDSENQRVKQNTARREAKDTESKMRNEQVKQLKKRVTEEQEIPQFRRHKAIQDRPEPEPTPYPKEKKFLAIQDGDPYDEVPQLTRYTKKTTKPIVKDMEVIKGPTSKQFKKAAFPKLAVSKHLERQKINNLEKADKLIKELQSEHTDKKQKTGSSTSRATKTTRKPKATKAN